MKSSEIRLGSYVLDLRAGRLRDKTGEETVLRHQTRNVLMMLAETPGDVVSKAAVFDKVWEGAHVSEDSLVQCIAEIRQAIGDENKTIIETVPRKGYRLVPTGSTSRRRPRPWHLAATAALLACLFAASVILKPNPVNAPRVVAVLPFNDDSVGSDQGQLGDLLSGEIIANLARFPELTVIARNSSFRFRDQTRGIPEIARELDADFVLEGSQRLDGSDLRVTAQLIDAAQNNLVWSDQIDAEINDLFRVSTRISSRIAHSVEAFVADAQLQSGGPNEVDALLLSQKSRRLLRANLSKENLEAAEVLDRESIRLYPAEAWGHISLAFTLRSKVRFGWAENPDETIETALSHAQKGVSLAPDNYAAHFALGRVRMQQGNQLGAIQAFETALQLNPSSADALNALAQSYFYLGQNDHAAEALARSERIDPLPNFVHSWMSAWALWQIEDCDGALDRFQRIASPPPQAHKLLAAIQVCRGNVPEAEDAIETFLASQPGWTVAREREIHEAQWIAEGSLPRWLSNLEAAGLPG